MSFLRAVSKKSIILLHGAWHARWCWKYVTPLLQKQGHIVHDPDLPGHGKDNTKFDQINLKTYVDYVTKLVEAQKNPVTLVGHSMAGVIISQVAENIPHRIDRLVYVAGFIPGNNNSLMITAKKSKTPGTSTETSVDQQKNEINLAKSSRTRDLFFNRCTETDKEHGMLQLQSEPFQPFLDVVKLSSGRFGKVKKVYIECLDDQAVTPEDQKRMYTEAGCEVVSLNADHSPFFSTPEFLTNAILGEPLEKKLSHEFCKARL